MEVKVVKSQNAASSEPSRIRPDSRGSRIIQYLAKTVSGSSLKEPNNEQALQNASEGEDSEEEMHSQPNQSPSVTSPSGNVQPTLFQKLSYRLLRSESPYTYEENPHHRNENAYILGVKKSVYEASRGFAADIRGGIGRLAQMKGVLIEKLSSMPSIPADSLDRARHSIEAIVADTSQAAYGKTKDAMLQIRLKLMEIIPSLFPHETKKIMDDAEREVNDMSKGSADDGEQGTSKVNDMSKASADDGEQGTSKVRNEDKAGGAIIAPQPTSSLAARLDRFKGLLQSRL